MCKMSPHYATAFAIFLAGIVSTSHGAPSAPDDPYPFMVWPELTLRNPRHAHSSLGPLLHFIIDHPVNKDRPAVTALGHGLDREEFNEVVGDFRLEDGMSLAYLYEVYGVTNGIKHVHKEVDYSRLYLVPGYFLLSLEDALQIYRNATNADNAWFPLLTSGKGDYIAVNLYDGSVEEFPLGDRKSTLRFINTHELLVYYAGLFQIGEIQSVDGGLVYDENATK